VRSITSGRGRHAEVFDHYEDVPMEIEKKLVEESKARREAAHATH
jgi:translation elongation factor EF-G